MSDATFEDGREVPLNLGALEEEDFKILSSLVQDAVLPISEMRWQSAQHRFALLLNRFRWEDSETAQRLGRGVERVQSLLVIENVLGVASSGVSRSDKDLILSLLSLSFEPTEDGAGNIVLTFAGDGAIKLQVEALEASLKDVTRPYLAPSGMIPDHGT